MEFEGKRAWTAATDRLATTYHYPIVMRVGRTQHNIELSAALEYLRDLRQAIGDVNGSTGDPLVDGVTNGLTMATNTELLAELRKRLEKAR